MGRCGAIAERGRRIGLALLALALAPAAALAESPLPSGEPCRLFHDGSPLVTLDLHGQTGARPVRLRVPQAYFPKVALNEAPLPKADASFKVDVASFLPMSGSFSGAAMTGGGSPMTVTLWQDHTLQEILLSQARIHLGVPRGAGFAELAVRPGPFGLSQVVAAEAGRTGDPTLIFVAGEKDGTAVISCAPESTDAPAECFQSFLAEGVNVQLAYPGTELANWQAMQADVGRFLDCAASDQM